MLSSTQDRNGQRPSRAVAQANLSLRPKTPPSVTFITLISKPTIDANARTMIRKQAMKTAGQARRKPGLVRRMPALQFELDVPPSTGGVPYLEAQKLREVQYLDQWIPGEGTALPRSGTPLQDEETYDEDELVLGLQQRTQGLHRQLLDRLGAGRKDPFFHCPVELDHYSKSLIDTLFDDRMRHFQAFRRSWFPAACQDKGAFHHVLSMSALCRSMLDTPKAAYEGQQSLKYSSAALRSLNSRLADKNLALTDGVITGIIGFICQFNFVGQYTLWRTHIVGLREIIRLRGGIESIKDQDLRIVIAWIEVTGSSTLDSPSSFDLPSSLVNANPSQDQLIRIPPLAAQISRTWRMDNLHRTPIIEIFDDLARFARDLNAAAIRTNGSVYNDTDFAGYPIIPFLHRLLANSLRPDPILDTASSSNSMQMSINAIMQEAIRLACLLFLVEIRRSFGVNPIVTTVQCGKLRDLLARENENEGNWELLGRGLGWLKVWVLVMGFMEGEGKERVWFRERLDVAMRPAGAESAREVMDALRELMWTDVHGVKYLMISQE